MAACGQFTKPFNQIYGGNVGSYRNGQTTTRLLPLLRHGWSPWPAQPYSFLLLGPTTTPLSPQGDQVRPIIPKSPSLCPWSDTPYNGGGTPKPPSLHPWSGTPCKGEEPPKTQFLGKWPFSIRFARGLIIACPPWTTVKYGIKINLNIIYQGIEYWRIFQL